MSYAFDLGNARAILATFPSRRFDAAAIILSSLIVIGCSVAQGVYDLDPHHWGLMVSNVVDLARGHEPYKEIFIQYGFLTTLTECVFFLAFGNVASVIFGASLFYALGLVGIYFLTLHFSKKRSLALYAFLTAVLIHPLAIYPWPNYVALPFITFGCLCVLKGKDNWLIGLLGGALLGGAVLAREELLLPLFPALIALAPIHYWCSRDWRGAKLRLSPLAGFVLVLGVFALYLWLSGLAHYWWQTAIELPKLYASVFLSHGPFVAVLAPLKYLLRDALKGHGRQLFFALIILSTLVLWLQALRRWRRGPGDPDFLFIALTTGLLLSSAVHLQEIFRLATSITLGAGLVYVLADRLLHRAGLVFAATAFVLIVGAFGSDNGDYFLPSRAQVKNATTSDRISLFAGQHWSQDVFDYYDWYVDATRVLETRGCGVRYLRNETRDAYLEALSPFAQYQLMPFGTGMHTGSADSSVDDWGRRLRPDYDLNKRLKARDILIVALQKGSPNEQRAAPDGHRTFNSAYIGQPAPEKRTPPDGYRLFARKITPKSWFLPDGHVTLLFAPVQCGEPLGY